jgi:pyruvate formate lyase activating enzyme
MAEPRTRRDFLATCAAAFCAASAAGILGHPRPARAQRPTRGLVRTKLSPYFTPLAGGEVRCELCPRRCRVPRGKRGFCRVRENRGGQYYSLVYGNPCALHPDPIEKKPFFHVLPGTRAYSVATAGCNFHCKFCQNWEISQAAPEDLFNYEVSPEVLVQRAREAGAHSVAYTYVEPTVFCEYMLDAAQAARKAGLLNVCHSNGFINPEPLAALGRVLDAANIDLKGFTQAFYRDLCEGELPPVLATLRALKRAGVHLEVTNLVIPTLNDDLARIREMCLWVKRELGPETPLHFSRFYPLYKLKNLPPTPVAILEQARAAALSIGLEYVYIGNIPGHEGENTFCPRCKRVLIERSGFMVRGVHLKGGKCGACGRPVPGIWA